MNRAPYTLADGVLYVNENIAWSQIPATVRVAALKLDVRSGVELWFNTLDGLHHGIAGALFMADRDIHSSP